MIEININKLEMIEININKLEKNYRKHWKF